MKKFKLVFYRGDWNCSIEKIEVKSFENSREVLNFVIREKINEWGLDWINYVNEMFNDECKGFENREESWEELFSIGDLNNDIFEIDFNNECNSCLVINEESEYFNSEFDLDLVNDIIVKYVY
jgi:hypothetical protein